MPLGDTITETGVTTSIISHYSLKIPLQAINIAPQRLVLLSADYSRTARNKVEKCDADSVTIHFL